KILSRSKLKDLGFQFSNDQFRTAIQKANESSFLLTNYQWFIPLLQAAIDETTKQLIIEFLHNNSQRSSHTRRKQNSDITEIYFLEKPK
ncbi:9579_t:CDS:1, partial [Dentiscutata erythropus]